MLISITGWGAIVLGVTSGGLQGAPRYPTIAPLAQPLSQSVISIGWSAFGSGTVRYHVVRNGNFVGSSSATSLNLVEQKLSAGTSYAYDVYADNGSGMLTWGGTTTAETLSAPLLWQSTFEENAEGGTVTIGGWAKQAADPTKVGPSTEQARAGSKSIKFSLLLSDWNLSDNGLRAEIGQTDDRSLGQHFRTTPTLGADFWVGISTFVDGGWEPDDANNGELLWQFHGQTGGPARMSPPISLTIHGTEVEIVLAAANGIYDCAVSAPRGSYLWTTDLANVRGKWVDWVIKVSFDYMDGKLDVWKDGKRIVSYSGPTLYRCASQSNDLSPSFDFGIYKPHWRRKGHTTKVSSRLLYVDEVRFANSLGTCADVKPTGALACAP
jgi:hypothetical protein